jgi:hypothetical protein
MEVDVAVGVRPVMAGLDLPPEILRSVEKKQRRIQWEHFRLGEAERW